MAETGPRAFLAPDRLEDVPEAELVARARERDEAAIRALIGRCNAQLFRVARGIVHNDGDAEDVVQATYVAAFTNLQKFRGEARFSTWLTRIAMNEAFGRLRRRRGVVDLSEFRDRVQTEQAAGGPNPMTVPPTTPEAELGRSEVRKVLERAIDTLPEPFRLTFVLRDVQEMSTREVAALLGVRPVTVKTRLFRARRLLRAELQRTVAGDFAALFPFDGQRCAGMAERVIAALARVPRG